jgi:hypothetical protein
MKQKWHQKTWDDLTEEQREAIKKVADAYNENMAKMIKYCEEGNKKEHLRCVAIERKLENKGIALRKEYGVFAQDPCPLEQRGRFCDSCSGIYIREGAKKRATEVKDKALLPKGTWVYECRMHPSRLNRNTLEKECRNTGVRVAVG